MYHRHKADLEDWFGQQQSVLNQMGASTQNWSAVSGGITDAAKADMSAMGLENSIGSSLTKGFGGLLTDGAKIYGQYTDRQNILKKIETYKP